jgi:hypothetical protein
MPKAMMRAGRSRTGRRRRIALMGAGGEGRCGSWTRRPVSLSLLIILEGVISCLPFSVIHASFFDYFPDDRLS